MRVMTHNKLLRACLGCLVLSLSIVSVFAQDAPPSAAQSISPQKQALIKELLELVNSKKTVDAMLKAQADEMEQQLPEIIWQAVSGMEEVKSLTPAQREEARLKVVSSSLRSGRRMYQLLLEKIDFNKLIEDISVPLYDKYLTEDELKDMVTFYKSPTGQKVINITPNLVVESMTRVSELIVPKITELMSQIRAEETERMQKEIQTTVKTIEKPAKTTPRPRSKRPRS
jgi:uncharacterized protein